MILLVVRTLVPFGLRCTEYILSIGIDTKFLAFARNYYDTYQIAQTMRIRWLYQMASLRVRGREGEVLLSAQGEQWRERPVDSVPNRR